MTLMKSSSINNTRVPISVLKHDWMSDIVPVKDQPSGSSILSELDWGNQSANSNSQLSLCISNIYPKGMKTMEECEINSL